MSINKAYNLLEDINYFETNWNEEPVLNELVLSKLELALMKELVEAYIKNDGLSLGKFGEVSDCGSPFKEIFISYNII